MKNLVIIMVFFVSVSVRAQTRQEIDINKEYKNIKLTNASPLVYTLPLVKEGVYQFSILQQGIAVYYVLTASNAKKLYESDDPDDIWGHEKFEYSPANSGSFTLTIKRYNDLQNPDSGRITILIKRLTKAEIAIKMQIKKDLEAENKRNVATIDVDHFWSAYDNLKTCKSFLDSVNSFQKLYLDKATNGLLDFIQVRDLTAEKFVAAVAKNAMFYLSVRKNTYEAKKAEPVIEDVFKRFKEIYLDFKPFKVCFAIGIKNTGGTVSNKFVLIGTEITTSTSGKDSVTSEEIVQKIKGMVAHECVHTQQKPHADSAAIQCNLLYQSIREGSCDFIAELITGKSRNNEYGDKNENKLWIEFKSELCNQKIGNWLYGNSIKDRPSDLGYFIGYEIAKEYYKNMINKKQAIVDIIETSDPIHFLELSKYDQKVKQ